MSDRQTAVITGASSGVGRAAAVALARQGWNVIGLGRDPDRSEAALRHIRSEAAPDAMIRMITGDLALLHDTARMADEILASTGPIRALCNNAGGVRPERVITPEGNEATFAGNHLGHFLLTKRLLPRLQDAAQAGQGRARIVAVSSEGHRQAPPFDWSDLQRIDDWVSGRNYCLAKLCNLLFTHELSRRYADAGIVAHGMHPGEAATNFASHAVPQMQAYMAGLDMIPPEVGGETLAWLASAAEPGRTTDGYYFDRQAVAPAPEAHDDDTAARLWDVSEALLARAGY